MSFNAVVELLDGQQGYALQAWTVSAQEIVQIGRSADAQISLRNPFVSRSHAYIHCPHGSWEIHSLSDGGLIIDGCRALSAELRPGMEFRLARKGPILRFRTESAADSCGGLATMNLDDEQIPLLVLDRDKRDEEVAEIEQQPYFGELQEIAHRLRNRRNPP